MKKIGFYPNEDKDINFMISKRLVDFILRCGCEAYTSKQKAEQGFIHDGLIYCDDIFVCSDIVLVLGGDGTMLKAAKTAARTGTPLIGINLGKLGYLTDADEADAFDALSKLLRGEYITQKRMMLELESSKGGDIALNDVCVTSGMTSKLIELELYVNEEYIDTYRADGIIISSPTGSTAYNLSAGGPLIKPDSKLIAATAICPHNLYARPIVVADTDVIDIISRKQGSVMNITTDGELFAQPEGFQKITIRRSSLETTIIKTNTLGFYDIVRKKLVWQVGL